MRTRILRPEQALRGRHAVLPEDDPLVAVNAFVSAQAFVTARALRSGVSVSRIADDQAMDHLTEAEARIQTVLGLEAADNPHGACGQG